PILVVNNAQDTSNDLVAQLRHLGFDNLDLIPYYPGCSLSANVLARFRVALTPGFPELVPAGIKRVIDVGVRSLDPSTLVELGVLLGRPLEDSHYYLSRKMSEVVGLAKKAIALAEKARGANRKYEAVLSATDDGMLYVTAEGVVDSVNEPAANLFGKAPAEVLGKNVRELHPALAELLDRTSEACRLVRLDARSFIVSRKWLRIDNGPDGCLLVMRDAADIEKRHEDLRAQFRVSGLKAKYSFSDIVGTSPSITRAIALASRLALTELTVLLVGENGTGKELFAHAIHNASRRRAGPFVPVNMASLSPTLLESELFGYEEGAFTGARRGGRPGLFEQAHGGTIFLDEVGDMPAEAQVRLLRVLQEREVMRVGGMRLIPVDVRVIAATHRDLAEAVEAGTFRKDLYYRLCACPLHVPPLRHRLEDIPLLINHFLGNLGAPPVNLPPDLLSELSTFDWPGNVRQLENLVRYAYAISGGSPPEFCEAMREVVRNSRRRPTEANIRKILQELQSSAPL
ncbi:MAG: sigma 54-interacting transcriptional regulator, partial [Synergistales bacterium]|nr:sigma 54-interacting transcriptional regulator [Synergistales bacterium]